MEIRSNRYFATLAAACSFGFSASLIALAASILLLDIPVIIVSVTGVLGFGLCVVIALSEVKG